MNFMLQRGECSAQPIARYLIVQNQTKLFLSRSRRGLCVVKAVFLKQNLTKIGFICNVFVEGCFTHLFLCADVSSRDNIKMKLWRNSIWEEKEKYSETNVRSEFVWESCCLPPPPSRSTIF